MTLKKWLRKFRQFLLKFENHTSIFSFCNSLEIFKKIVHKIAVHIALWALFPTEWKILSICFVILTVRDSNRLYEKLFVFNFWKWGGIVTRRNPSVKLTCFVLYTFSHFIGVFSNNKTLIKTSNCQRSILLLYCFFRPKNHPCFNKWISFSLKSNFEQ